MDVATGVVTTLFDYTPASFDSAPAWSPDGRQIAFESNLDGDMEIYVMNADGSGVRQITHNTLWDEGPAWSPDGTKFAFSSGADDVPPRHLDDERRRLGPATADDVSRAATSRPTGASIPGPAAVGGTVPATLSLQLGTAASLGTFLPGVARRLHGDDGRHGHQHRRRRDPERPRHERRLTRPARQRHVRAPAAAAGARERRRLRDDPGRPVALRRAGEQRRR